MASRDGTDTRYIIELLETFFKHKLLAWLEVLSIVGDLRCAVYSLRDVKAWLVKIDLSEADLSAIVMDSERFVVRFFDVIEESALHTYRSALPWCPRSSLVRQLYQDQIPNKVNLLNSVDKSWDACTRVIEIRNMLRRIIYSHQDDLMALCEERCVEIFKVSTGQRQTTLTMNQNGPTSAAFSPDNTLIVTGYHSGLINIWDLQTGTLAGALEGHTRSVVSFAFSPCGAMVASGSRDCTVRIWNLSSYDCQCVLEGHSDTVQTVSWLPAGRQVVSGSFHKSVRVWDIVGQKCFNRIIQDDLVMTVACSSDSALIASGSSGGTTTILDAQTGDVTRDRIMYTTGDQTFVIRDLNGNENELMFKYDGNIAAISSDGKSVASGSGRSVKLWQTGITDLDPHRDQDSHAMKVTCIAFSGDGQLVASGSADGTVKVWRTTTGLCLHTFRDFSCCVTCVTFSPDSRFCASASQDTTILVWDVHTGTRFSSLCTGSHILRFSPDGRQLLSLWDSDHLTLWEVRTSLRLAETNVGYCPQDISFPDVGSSIILQSDDGSVKRWRISPAPSSKYKDVDGKIYSSFPLVFIPMHDEQQSTPLAVAPCQYDYDMEKGWFSDEQGRKVFWVPPDRRGQVDRYGEKFAIGSDSGKITFVDLSDVQVECPI